VSPDLALVDHRLLVREQELDRVLDREDVAGHLLVALLQHRRERGGLAGARGAHHEDQAALLEHQRVQQRRQVQRVECRDVVRNAAQHRGDRTALLEAAQAKAAHARQPDPDVELAGVFELLELRGRQQLGQQLARLGVRQRLVRQLQDLPVDLDEDRRVGRQVDVRGALLGHQPKHPFHVPAHAIPFVVLCETRIISRFHRGTPASCTAFSQPSVRFARVHRAPARRCRIRRAAGR
jgi:hypothetical protein